MSKGISNYTRYIYKYYLSQREVQDEVNSYVKKALECDYLAANKDNVQNLFSINHETLDLDSLQVYCAPLLSRFESINAALRHKWEFGYHGDNNLKIEMLDIAQKIDYLILMAKDKHKPLFVYRGVDLYAFKDYSIDNLDELLTLKGKILYDAGFQSTALLEDKCYFGKADSFGRIKNIKIVGYIPSEFMDGIYIDDSIVLSKREYNPYEYLISSGTLSYVSEVSINKDDNTAIIYAVFIPKEVWDIGYRNSLSQSEKKFSIE